MHLSLVASYHQFQWCWNLLVASSADDDEEKEEKKTRWKRSNFNYVFFLSTSSIVVVVVLLLFYRSSNVDCVHSSSPLASPSNGIMQFSHHFSCVFFEWERGNPIAPQPRTDTICKMKLQSRMVFVSIGAPVLAVTIGAAQINRNEIN